MSIRVRTQLSTICLILMLPRSILYDASQLWLLIFLFSFLCVSKPDKFCSSASGHSCFPVFCVFCIVCPLAFSCRSPDIVCRGVHKASLDTLPSPGAKVEAASCLPKSVFPSSPVVVPLGHTLQNYLQSDVTKFLPMNSTRCLFSWAGVSRQVISSLLPPLTHKLKPRPGGEDLDNYEDKSHWIIQIEIQTWDVKENTSPHLSYFYCIVRVVWAHSP